MSENALKIGRKMFKTFTCKHLSCHVIYGDEIIASGYKRLACNDCFWVGNYILYDGYAKVYWTSFQNSGINEISRGENK